MSTLLSTALTYRAAHLSVVPCDVKTKKPLLPEWKTLQRDLPSETAVRAMFRQNHRALGVLCGAISRNREGIDIDNKPQPGYPDAETLFAVLHQLVEDAQPGLWDKLVIERTTSGGYHLIYRCDTIEGNAKLATRPATDAERSTQNNPKLKSVTMIETRGEGGYLVSAPSPGYVVLQGDLAAPALLSADERAVLWSAARSLTLPTDEPTGTRDTTGSTGRRPGDDYNERGDPLPLLERAGWTIAQRRGDGSVTLCRPGKTKHQGISATYGYVDDRVLYVFTTGGSPFDDGRTYSPFAVYTLLEHHGDYAAAAKALAAQGFGDPLPAKEQPSVDTKHATENRTAETPGQQLASAVIADALTALGYAFRLNHVTGRIEVNGDRLDDGLAAEIRMRMRDRKLKDRLAIEDVYTTLARRNSYHPIRDYLDSLQWDGKNHILKLASCFTCDDPDLIGTDGRARSLVYIYLYRWMIGAVAKVVEQGQNMMLVLAGPQGIGKSHFAEWLAAPLAPYFVSQAVNAEEKDSALRLTNHFLWEVDELDGTIRRSDVAALKAFITKRTVVARPAYARHDIEAPAIASLIGTVNRGAGFLADVTGNRRFYVATISQIDWSYTTLDVDQLWAQAVAEYRRGTPWTLQAPEKAAQNEANKEHEVSSLLDDWLETDFIFGESTDAGMTAAEMVNHMDSRGHVLRGNPRQQAMELASALAKRSVAKRKINNQQTYLGVMRSGNNE